MFLRLQNLALGPYFLKLPSPGRLRAWTLGIKTAARASPISKSHPQDGWKHHRFIAVSRLILATRIGVCC
jgi:hypothetical protein